MLHLLNECQEKVCLLLANFGRFSCSMNAFLFHMLVWDQIAICLPYLSVLRTNQFNALSMQLPGKQNWREIICWHKTGQTRQDNAQNRCLGTNHDLHVSRSTVSANLVTDENEVFEILQKMYVSDKILSHLMHSTTPRQCDHLRDKQQTGLSTQGWGICVT